MPRKVFNGLRRCKAMSGNVEKRVAGLRNVELRRERYDSDLDVDSEKK